MKLAKKLEKKDILHLAKLANLTLSEKESEKYQKQLSSILEYVEQLKEVNTDSVEATAHTTGLKNIWFQDGSSQKRSLSLKNLKVQEKKGKKYFVVDRIL